MAANKDYDYIISVVEYLSSRHGVQFSISSGDFDLLYAWWEKGVSAQVVKSAIDRVVERRRTRRQPVTSFSQFRYEVNKQHAAWLERGVGGGVVTRPLVDPVQHFMENFPHELETLRPRFEAAAKKRRCGEKVDEDGLRRDVAALFHKDRELNFRVRVFMQNLSPELRLESVEWVYRANFLWNRFHIPDFTLLEEESG
ncbi:MAG TPA: hypothetical protein ENN40_04630 [Candidatus Aminicenantes bacterium]|nr:hypothetical protein [Candidatus Aminicenantes bacterium]